MRVCFVAALLACGLSATAAHAADKDLPIGRSSNQFVEIDADLLLTTAEIRDAIGPNIAGSDLGGNFVVVRMTVRPVSDTPVKIWRDDFTLLSHKDGQRSTPFGPSQIAGSGAIVIKTRQGDTVGTKADRVPIWAGGPIGGGGFGNATVQQPTAEAEVKDDEGSKDSPLLAALRAKILPEKSITEPVTGLLYFQIDGKIKPKDLELFYKAENGDRLALRFPNNQAGR